MFDQLSCARISGSGTKILGAWVSKGHAATFHGSASPEPRKLMAQTPKFSRCSAPKTSRTLDWYPLATYWLGFASLCQGVAHWLEWEQFWRGDSMPNQAFKSGESPSKGGSKEGGFPKALYRKFGNPKEPCSSPLPMQKHHKVWRSFLPYTGVFSRIGSPSTEL